jgi:hypothetical protein
MARCALAKRVLASAQSIKHQQGVRIRPSFSGSGFWENVHLTRGYLSGQGGGGNLIAAKPDRAHAKEKSIATPLGTIFIGASQTIWASPTKIVHKSSFLMTQIHNFRFFPVYGRAY